MDLYMDLWNLSMGFNKIRLDFFVDISWELNDHLMGLNGIEGISWVFSMIPRMGQLTGFHLDFINGF